jgi:DnaD/phage-associated family protein
MELMHSFEGEVRKLFGMKTRSLTKREKEMLRSWVSYGFGIEIVSLAYDMTVTATNEPSAPYTHAILKRWHEEGLKTLADIQRAEKEKKAQKAASAALGNSFETDDFFKAALERSFSSDPKQS